MLGISHSDTVHPAEEHVLYDASCMFCESS
jgi:hypothetical protein